jgi:large subunit ribosomal protein L25
MRKDITVAAATRTERGKNAARRMRVAGQIPAVFYGAGGANVALAVSPKEINRILHSSTGHNTIFNLAVSGGETAPAMIVDWSHDPVKDTLLHIDMLRIDLTKQIEVKVPVQLAGDAFGVKTEGGLMEVVNREIEVMCLPDDIPAHFTVNVAGLHIGQSIRAGDVSLGEGIKLLSPPDAVVCHVIAVRESVEEVAPAEGEVAAAAAPAEPEVIKKGKKEEEGAEKSEKAEKGEKKK